jgi:lipopolysaccharide exporter
MAMIVVGSLEIFNRTGQTLVLIRLENPTQEHYNSAFTFIIGTLVVLVILIVAPFSVAYVHEPRAVTVMQALALRAFVGGFENAGTIDVMRDLKFNRFFIYNIVPKILSVVVTIALAVLQRNSWALVGGAWSASLRASP